MKNWKKECANKGQPLTNVWAAAWCCKNRLQSVKPVKDLKKRSFFTLELLKAKSETVKVSAQNLL